MNKLEAAYAQHLNLLKHEKMIRDWQYESIRLVLAPRTSYTPDFNVTLIDGTIQMHETKGRFFRDDARVKLKVAANKFPQFQFLLVTREKTGLWNIDAVNG